MAFSFILSLNYLNSWWIGLALFTMCGPLFDFMFFFLWRYWVIEGIRNHCYFFVLETRPFFVQKGCRRKGLQGACLRTARPMGVEA
ncbi:hypothetical protein J3F84DRAFT_193172 [Trichoderma pleuroticola]